MACINADFAALYTAATPINVWPQQPYPVTRGPYLSTGSLLDTQRAWAFYEQVEAYDAQQRQQANPQWYVFASNAEVSLYRKGQTLHTSICPCVDWRSQRYQALVVPGGDVRPQVCGS